MPRPPVSPRPLIVARTDTRNAALHTGALDGEAGRRTDFFLLRDELQGGIVDENDIRESLICRVVQSVAGTYVALALAAFRQRRSATAYITGSENEAIILAVLLRLVRSRIPLVAVGTYPAKAAKSVAWRWARVHRSMYRVMPLGTAQADRLINGLGVPREKVEVLPYGVDTEYWTPEKARPLVTERPYVFAAGLQHRDYATLISATEGLQVDLVIAAASLWAKTRNELEGAALPPWVTVKSMGYPELRDTYAGATAVVAPVVETDFSPGMTSIVEGMSMGRPVVVTRSEGTGDYIEDRRRVLRRGPIRATSASYSARFAERSAQGQSGFFVPPGDVDELRSVLMWILEHPAEAEAIGTRGRAVARQVYSLEAYVSRIVRVVEQGISETRRPTSAAAARAERGTREANASGAAE